MKISILTATYNRAQYLDRLYKSIVGNLSKDFDVEWLIMDDGSTDDTCAICNSFKDLDGFSVKYYHQENQGKMQAINNLSEYVTGDLWIECDSDDFFVENALKIIAKESKILQENKSLYAMVFLKNEKQNQLSGSRFPFEGQETTMFDLYFKHNLDGEKIIVFNSKIRKQYQYILEENERFCTEARLYHSMDLQYKIVCYNIVIVEGMYLSDGYTKNINKIFKSSPRGHERYFKEILVDHDMKGVSYKKRLYVIKHYILFKTMLKEKIELRDIKGKINKLLILVLFIPGRIKACIWMKKNIKENV